MNGLDQIVNFIATFWFLLMIFLVMVFIAPIFIWNHLGKLNDRVAADSEAMGTWMAALHDELKTIRRTVAAYAPIKEMNCPRCEKPIQMREDFVGKLSCPHCKQGLSVD